MTNKLPRQKLPNYVVSNPYKTLRNFGMILYFFEKKSDPWRD
jgi:hypothetical protein